ncbi:MAG: hypothetical protein H6Q73_1647 [Firmicutes bacterium]|nr:hypothetical protein [Bacillota bacterium]
MTKFLEIEQVHFYEINSVLPLTPNTTPLTSPFPITITTGETINLALINVPVGSEPDGILLNAIVNWSATFTPTTASTTINTPGYADATFELLRNGILITRITQTAAQKGIPLNSSLDFSTPIPTYEIASIMFFDTKAISCKTNIYTLRITNISLVAPLVASGTATTSAQIGAICLIGQRVNAHRNLTPVATT